MFFLSPNAFTETTFTSPGTRCSAFRKFQSGRPSVNRQNFRSFSSEMSSVVMVFAYSLKTASHRLVCIRIVGTRSSGSISIFLLFVIVESIALLRPRKNFMAIQESLSSIASGSTPPWSMFYKTHFYNNRNEF